MDEFEVFWNGVNDGADGDLLAGPRHPKRPAPPLPPPQIHRRLKSKRKSRPLSPEVRQRIAEGLRRHREQKRQERES